MERDQRDPVKEFLRSVREAKFRYLRCLWQVEDLRTRCASTTAAWSDVPGGGGEGRKDGALLALADKSARLVESVENSTTNNSTSTATTFAPSINVQIEVQGNADQNTADIIAQQVRQQVEAVCRKVYDEMRQQEYDIMTIKHAYA